MLERGHSTEDYADFIAFGTAAALLPAPQQARRKASPKRS